MCDVLDLSLRCQSQQPLPPVDHISGWTTSPTQVNTSPAWSNSTASRGHYDLEPISPSTSPPASYLDRRELDAFYQRRPVDNAAASALRQSPTAGGRWSCDDVVATTSAIQTISSAGRRWNGDDGHPYSPLKRVLHQYRNGVAEEENAAESHSGSAPCTTTRDVTQSPPITSTTTTGTCRKPPTTTAGMSFEEFVLGMLSKVGGGKAITAATQSYLRSTATSVSNRSNGTTSGLDAVAPQGDAAPRMRYDIGSAHQTTSEQRKQLEQRQMMTGAIHCDEYGATSFHAGSMSGVAAAPELQYSAPRPPLGLPSCQLPAALRRPLAVTRGSAADDRDDAYRERRRKNNEAAKRSRDTRRLKELQVAAQAERLAEENLQLKAEIAVLRSQLGYLHRMMLDNNNASSQLNGAVSGSDASRPDQNRASSAHQYPPEDGGRTV